MPLAIVVNRADNIATAFEDIEKEEKVNIESLTREKTDSLISIQKIPIGHKLSISSIEKGEEIKKFGESIGHASQAIDRGEYVHRHNLQSNK